MLTHNNIKLKNITYNGQKVKKWNHNGVRIYNAGSTVTYCVDTDTVYTEEVDSEASCLSPKTFTPTKSGWNFVGWRENKVASSTVLTSKIMGDSPITLYAVFKKAITVTRSDNTVSAEKTSKDRYYNNGNVVNPSFAFTQTAASGWTSRGWSTSNAGNATITYSNGTSFERDSDVTLYASYQQTITVTYYNGDIIANTTTGIRYWGLGGIINPSFTLTQAAKTGCTARGWSTGTAGNSAISYNNATAFTRDSDVTLYGMYYRDITCTFISNGAQTASGTIYYNSNGNTVGASVTVPTGKIYSGWTWRGWAAAGVTTADAAVAYANGATISGLHDNATFYGLHYRTLTLTYYNGSATASSTTGNQYHNAYGTSKEPSFTMTQAGISGWTARGWSTSSAGNASISYNNGATITLTGNLTIYGCYQISCNLYTVSNGSTKTNSGTRYYNSAGNYISPTFTVANPTRSGWTFKGWSISTSNTTVSYTAINKLTITASTYLYAVWNCANVAGSASLDYDQTRFFEGTETLATIISSVDTSKYSGVTFNFGVAENLKAETDYRGTQIDVYISDGTNKTLIVYGYDDWNGNQVDNQGRVLAPTLIFSSNSGNKPVYLTSTCHAYGQTTATGSVGHVFAYCTSYTLIGRTVVY